MDLIEPEPPKAPNHVSYNMLIIVMAKRPYELYSTPDQIYWAELYQALFMNQMTIQLLAE